MQRPAWWGGREVRESLPDGPILSYAAEISMGVACAKKYNTQPRDFPFIPRERRWNYCAKVKK